MLWFGCFSAVYYLVFQHRDAVPTASPSPCECKVTPSSCSFCFSALYQPCMWENRAFEEVFPAGKKCCRHLYRHATGIPQNTFPTGTRAQAPQIVFLPPKCREVMVREGKCGDAKESGSAVLTGCWGSACPKAQCCGASAGPR